MPLRDHFHAPWLDHNYWESFHDGWINTLVRHLNGKLLPKRFRALPQVHLGIYGAADVAAMKKNGRAATGNEDRGHESAGVATAVWAPPKPHHTLHVSFPEEDIFEVRIHDTQRRLRLVGAIELVSPANKDRPGNRRAFTDKCAAYLKQCVGVVVVDVVTSRRGNLHKELLQFLAPKQAPRSFAALYAAAYRHRPALVGNGKSDLETWPIPLAVGKTLPTLPLWLTDGPVIPIDLEKSYEETCQVLRVE